jgi:hypothetical protein
MVLRENENSGISSFANFIVKLRKVSNRFCEKFSEFSLANKFVITFISY